MKKKMYIILSFLIPFLIYAIIFYKNSLFNDKTIIQGDMYAQYYPLFNYLKGIFNGTNSIFYSLSKGLGGTMFGTFFYYLSSPLNILIIFFSKKNIPEFMTLLTLIKLSLCGLTMYIYMRKKFKDDNMILLVFSMCYAFMGYNINYFLHIMWLDVIILAPLIMVGLDRIIEDKSPIIYIVTLTISIFSNYYISYMVCLFSLSYLIYELLLKYNIKRDKKIIKRIIKKYITCSILSGLMCSFFIIPCIFEMLNYGRGVKIDEILTFDYNFFDLFSKSYIGSLDLNDTLNYSSMNIYCGVIILPLIYLFLTNSSINKKERKLTLIFIIILIIPCFIGILNYIWHLFTIPAYYSFRYSFLLCFLMIRISYKSLITLKIDKLKIYLYMTLYLIISLMMIIITYKGNYYDFLNYKLIWITLAFFIIYMIIIYNSEKKILKNLLVILILIENFTNIYIIFDRRDFIEKNRFEIIKQEEEKIDNYIKENGYRLESSLSLTPNDSILLKYKGISNFLSTTNYRNIYFPYYFGYNEKDAKGANIFTYYNSSSFLNTIVGIKYYISNRKINEYKIIDKITIDEKEYYIYRNDSALSIGYTVKNKCNNKIEERMHDNELYNCLFNTNVELYKEYEPYEIKDDIYKYKLKKDDYTHIFINKKDEEEIQLLKDNQELLENATYISNDHIIIYNKEEKLELKTSENQDFSLYRFDYKTFINNINTNQMQIEKIDNNILKGSIELNNQEILMITLPYEKGFEIYVDDKKTDYFEVANSFIGIDIEKGKHKITIKYKQPGLKLGIIMSLIAFIVTMIYISSNKKKEKNEVHRIHD